MAHSKPTLTFDQALNIVLELARQNILDDAESAEMGDLQERACDLVEHITGQQTSYIVRDEVAEYHFGPFSSHEEALAFVGQSAISHGAVLPLYRNEAVIGSVEETRDETT